MSSVLLTKLGQLLPCFILYSKAKLACYSRYLLNSYFCVPVPYNEKDIFWGYLFQKVLQVFIELFNFSFFGIIGQGIELGYCDIEWFVLETNRDHSVFFETALKYCISDSFVDYEGYFISSKREEISTTAGKNPLEEMEQHSQSTKESKMQSQLQCQK